MVKIRKSITADQQILSGYEQAPEIERIPIALFFFLLFRRVKGENENEI